MAEEGRPKTVGALGVASAEQHAVRMVGRFEVSVEPRRMNFWSMLRYWGLLDSLGGHLPILETVNVVDVVVRKRACTTVVLRVGPHSSEEAEEALQRVCRHLACSGLTSDIG